MKLASTTNTERTYVTTFPSARARTQLIGILPRLPGTCYALRHPLCPAARAQQRFKHLFLRTGLSLSDSSDMGSKRKQTEIELPASVVSAEVKKKGERYVVTVWTEETDEAEREKDSKEQCREHSFVKKVPLRVRDNGEYSLVCRHCGWVA